MFYFAYAGHNIPPKRIEFGKIQKNPPGPNGGGTRISITGKTPEEKAVWQTLGEGNEDCVEWVVLCAALNLLECVSSLSLHISNLISHVATKSSRLLRRIRRLPPLRARYPALALAGVQLPSPSAIPAPSPLLPQASRVLLLSNNSQCNNPHPVDQAFPIILPHPHQVSVLPQDLFPNEVTHPAKVRLKFLPRAKVCHLQG
jgi:hypothetical protein